MLLRRWKAVRKLDPGEVAAISLLAGGLGISAVLVALGCEPTSTCVRRSKPLKIAYGILFLHMAITVPGDPLTATGHLIEQVTLARRSRLTQDLPSVPAVMRTTRDLGLASTPSQVSLASSLGSLRWDRPSRSSSRRR